MSNSALPLCSEPKIRSIRQRYSWGDDVLKIDSFAADRLADPVGHQGGLYQVDLLGQNGGTRGGDTIEFSDADIAIKSDFGATDPFVSSRADENTRIIVRGAERVIGSAGDDILIGSGAGVVLEGRGGHDEIHLYGGDIGIGGGGADDFYVYTDRSHPGDAPGSDGGNNQVLILVST